MFWTQGKHEIFKWLSRILTQPQGPGKKALLDFPKGTQNKHTKRNRMKGICQIFGELVEILFIGFRKSMEVDPWNKRNSLLIIKMVPELLQYRKALNLGICKSELKTVPFWFDVSRQYHVVYDSQKQRGFEVLWSSSPWNLSLRAWVQWLEYWKQEPGDTQEACFQYPSDLEWLFSFKAKNVLI